MIAPLYDIRLTNLLDKIDYAAHTQGKDKSSILKLILWEAVIELQKNPRRYMKFWEKIKKIEEDPNAALGDYE